MNRPLALLVAATFFMEILDGTIIATAAPGHRRRFGVAPVDVNIAMTAYLIAIAAGIPISGWLTDRFGGRRISVIADRGLHGRLRRSARVSVEPADAGRRPGAAGYRRRH